MTHPASASPTRRQFVVMGVTSCGKSAVAEALANAIGAACIEGDALHGEANIAKMSRGEPLTDDDRWPWLARVSAELAQASPLTVASCSALCRRYRDALRADNPDTTYFIHLAASKDVIAERMQARAGHFMPPALLDSQFALLEPLEADESGTVIDVADPLDSVVQQAVAYARTQLPNTSPNTQGHTT